MAVIHELDAHLADLIAAGEVVERPASVAKELIENSIDAGATAITVEMQNGGISYLRIADNGAGMSCEDAPIAFRRHATSKIRLEEDLASIGTLGFRGEALAAISSVSRVSLFTKQNGALEGTHLELEAGSVHVNEAAGCPEGTTFIVRDLFYNTPARMKFLKKDFTEANYVLAVVQHAALSNPQVAFKCIRDGKTVFNSPGTGELFPAVYNVFGRELSNDLIECDSYEMNGFRVWGYLSKPHAPRANRSMQHFFVNGRYVKSRLIQAALEEAYKNSIITGKYPYGCIHIALPYAMVDVNVHPAKTEVKFALEKQVFEVVYAACKNSLSKDDNIPQIKDKMKDKSSLVKEDNLTAHQQQMPDLKPPDMPVYQAETAVTSKVLAPHLTTSLRENSIPPKLLETLQESGMLRQTATISYHTDPAPRPFAMPPRQKEALEENAAEPEMEELIPRMSHPMIHPVHSLPVQEEKQPEGTAKPAESLMTGTRVIGQCFQTYIIAEDKEGLLLIDKHAAHERILFNKLRKTAEIPIQVLLTPVVSDFSVEETAALTEGLEQIRKMGFDIESFGDHSFITRQIPAYLDSSDISVTLSEIAQKLTDRRIPLPDRFDELIHTVSCKAAIKAGSKTSDRELQELCDRVLADPEVTCCPHGRPVTVRLTKYELDKMFKRVNQ